MAPSSPPAAGTANPGTAGLKNTLRTYLPVVKADSHAQDMVWNL